MHGRHRLHAEVLLKQHRQRGESAAVSGVDEEQHCHDQPQGAVVDRMREDLQRAHRDGHDEDHQICGLTALTVVGQRGEPDTSGRVEHGVDGQDDADASRDGRGQLGRVQRCVLRKNGQRIMQDVLLLGDQCQTAGDVEVEGQPDRPEHRLLHDVATADAGLSGVHVSAGTLDQRESQQHHHRIDGCEDVEHGRQSDGGDQPLHDRACDGLGQTESRDGDAGGETLIVGEPQHQVLHRRQITDAESDAHDHAIEDEHAGEPSRRDADSGAGESADEADRRDQGRFLDVLFDEGSKEGGRHAKEEDGKREAPFDDAWRHVHLIGDQLFEHAPAVYGAD